jgi:outer membrane protein assembly factor BamB
LTRSFLATLAILLFAAQIHAEEWPRWRGLRGDGITSETIPDKLPKDGPKKLWSKTVGVGYSSPVAVDGKVYMFALSDGRDTLYAFDEAGNQLWKEAYDGGWTRNGDYPGTRASPVIENGKIYTYGGAGDLVARDLSGKQLWRINILKETNATSRPDGDWGMGSNPLIDGSKIIVQGGNGDAFAVAVDKNAGTILWKSEKGLGGYAEPIIADVNGSKQVVVFAGPGLYGLNPETGKTLWKYPWKTRYDVNAATPIYKDGKLFIASNYGKGCGLIAIDQSSAKKVYENKEAQCRFQPPILEGDVMYVNSEGRLKCITLADGKPTWPAPAPDSPGMGGSLTRSKDKLLIMTDGGKLIIGQATPTTYKHLAEAQLFENGKGQIWSTPLLYKGKLYAKGSDELACYDLTAK